MTGSHYNAEEQAARAVKVSRLVATLDAVHADTAYVRGMADLDWALAARVADVRAPSETTRLAVVRVFERRDRDAAVQADPWEGLPS